MTLERHYKSAELAELLSVNPETIRRLAAAGQIRSIRIGNDRRYPESAVREYLHRQEQPAVPHAAVVPLAAKRNTRPSRTRRTG